MSKTGASRPTDTNAPVFTAETENAITPVSDSSISEETNRVNIQAVSPDSSLGAAADGVLQGGLVLPGVDSEDMAGYDVDTSNNRTGGADNGRRAEGQLAQQALERDDARRASGALLRDGAPQEDSGGRGSMAQAEERADFLARKKAEGETIQRIGPFYIAYRETQPERYRSDTVQAVRDYQEFGIKPIVVDSFERNSGGRTIRTDDAVTGPDGQVYLGNGSTIDSRNSSAHEAFHVGLRRNLASAQRFYEMVQGVNVLDETVSKYLGEITDTYFEETGRRFDPQLESDMDTLMHEFAAFISGAMNDGTALELFSSGFSNFNALQAQWQAMKNEMGRGGSAAPGGPSGMELLLPGTQPGAEAATLPIPDVGSEQSGASVAPDSSVGAAPAGFDPWSHFQGTRSEFIPEGANAARPVDVPTTDPQGRRIRRTASTAMGAKAIPDEVVGDIQNMVLRGELSYNRVSDKASINRAIKTIQDKGYQGALEEFRNSVNKGVISKDIATLGQQLLINAANAGDSRTTAELLSLYAQMETTAGQAVQAASILRKLDPSAQLYAAQRVVNDLEKAIQDKYKDIEITIDQSLIDEFNSQTTQEGRDAVMDRIYQNVADQVPSTWRDKWNAWRYLAMLANPRTHVRNFVGNIGFQPLRFAKDRVASVIEAGVSRAGGNIERTKSFASAPELYRAAWNDWTNVKDVLSGNKYDDVRSEINSRRRIFKTAPLEAARTGNSWLLEFEDSIFKRITYADALAGYLQANGVTAEQVLNNTVDASLMTRARDYAGQEALKATYQDRNQFSDLMSRRARETGAVSKAANVALDAVLPFRRTPANVAVRAVEYSPLGLIGTAAKGIMRFIFLNL